MRKEFVKNEPSFLVLCQLFYPEMVSTGQTLTELCEVLVDMGIDIEVVCGPPTILVRESSIPSYMEHRGIRIKRVWGTRFNKLNFVGRVANQITFALSVFVHLVCDGSKRPILVLTNPPFLALICGLLRKFHGVPYIYLIFDVYPETAIKLGILKEKGVVSRVWDWCNKFMFEYASVIIVIGRCMQDILARKLSAEARRKIRVIHVWSDDNLIQAASVNENPFIKKWGLEGKFVVSYSGNMGRFHDMETIMEAAKGLKGRDDIVFLFIGEGHKKQWSKDFADKWKLKNCQFHSYVDREDLGFSLKSADIGLVSLLEGQEGLSVPSKTFGLMAAGVPVIAIMSNTSEIARIVEEEQCGVVVRPGEPEELVNAILNLYNDRLKLSDMSKHAMKAIKNKYNLRTAAEAYYEIIAGLNKSSFKESNL